MAKKEVIEMINAEATKMSAKKIEIDQWAVIQENKAKTSFETSKNRYEAMLMEARAEMEFLEGIKANRKQELRLEKAKVLQELAANSKILMTGDQGDDFMRKLFDFKIEGLEEKEK